MKRCTFSVIGFSRSLIFHKDPVFDAILNCFLSVFRLDPTINVIYSTSAGNSFQAKLS